MALKNTILIYIPTTYGGEDNLYNNWVDNFKTILRITLNQIIKQKFEITILWGGKLSASVIDEINKSDVVINLLIDKTIAPKEYFPFNEVLSKTILQVYCNPEMEHPFIENAGNMRLVNFYDETLRKEVNLTGKNNELKNEIWLKFLDISYEIKKLNKNKEAINSKQIIFVAETSSDQNQNKENIIRELEHLGYKVLPDLKFPKDLEPYNQFVYDSLKESFLSIHIIGNDYSPLLQNIEISTVELQNDLFVEVAAELNKGQEKIKRLVWIPPGLKYKSEKQKFYVESFKRNIELLRYTEIIQAPIEVFKTIIRNKINEKGESAVKQIEILKDGEKKVVYLISDDSNSKIREEVKQELIKKNLEVLETTNSKNKIDLIKEHYNGLINCDAVLIIYSVDNEQWLNSKICDILKSPGFGKKKKYLAKSVFVNTSNNPVINIQLDGLDIINNRETKIEKRLNSFIEKIR